MPNSAWPYMNVRTSARGLFAGQVTCAGTGARTPHSFLGDTSQLAAGGPRAPVQTDGDPRAQTCWPRTKHRLRFEQDVTSKSRGHDFQEHFEGWSKKPLEFRKASSFKDSQIHTTWVPGRLNNGP